MEVRVLGSLELRAGERTIPVRRGRPRRLFLGLLLRAGAPVPTEVLIDELWEDTPPQNAANALQILMSYLRKVLADAPGTLTIETTPAGYRLAVGDADVDVHRFERAVAAAAARPPVEQVALLDEALALWRGTPYAELAYDDFARGDIVRLQELRLAALETRAEAMLDIGRAPDVVTELQRLVVEQPLRERFHAQLMLALYRCGRQADALRAFDAARALLRDELGLDPGPELRDLQSAILRHDTTLLAPTSASPPDGSRPARGTASGQLPVVLDGDTIGRAGAIAKVRGLLTAHRVVTLTGPGGAGKSRVASEVVRDGRRVAWVDLSAADDAAGVLRALSSATGAPLPSEDDDGDALVSHLQSTDGVVVLDTCEHVVDALRPFVDRIVEETGVSVLATSRQPLRSRGELAWPVPPLGLPDPMRLTLADVRTSDAVELFRRRATAVNGSFELDECNAGDVGRICLLLDGLPLAIELAAAHAAALTPSTIVRLLDDRLRLLVSTAGAERQQTLRATIDWSYARLGRGEQRFLDRLAVFAGPFSLDAAVEVAGYDIDGDPLTVLLALVNQSLVVVAGDDRYRLLDTIRAYTSERLHGDDRAAVRARHADWYLSFAKEANRHIRGNEAATWTVELRSELPNLRAALDWSFGEGDARTGAALASELSWFWAIEGLFGEADRWLEAAMGAVEPGTRVEALLVGARGMHASSMGDLERCRRECSRAAELFDALDDPRGVANALIYLGVAQWGLGRLTEAAASHDRGASLFREVGYDWGLAISLVLRARTAADAGEDGVADLIDAALPVARRSGDAHVIGMCLEQRSRQALLDGDADLATLLARESLDLHASVGYAEGRVASLHALGLARGAAGRLDEAADLHTEGLRIATELDHPGGIAEGLECLAVVAARRGEHLEALRLFAASDAFRAERGVPRPASRQALLAPHLIAADDGAPADDAARARAAGRLLDPLSLLHG